MMSTFDRSTKADQYDMTALVLTGPPASGKSTITELLADQGVPTIDTGELVRQQARQRVGDETEITEDLCWSVAEELRDIHGEMAPTCLLGEQWLNRQRGRNADIICVSAVRNEAEVDWLRDHISNVLVVRVRADDVDRLNRYVEMKLDTDEQKDSVSEARINELREELSEREHRERPYPRQDISINSGDAIRFKWLTTQLSNLLAALRA